MSKEDPCIPIKEVEQLVQDNKISRTPYMLCGKPHSRSSKLGCAPKPIQVSAYSRPVEDILQNSYIVDLRQRTCDCGIFQTFKYPCVHIFTTCASIHFDAMTLVDPIYQLQTVFKVY
ncbi:hypothetical protein GQ457_12G017610 [Hibiscus cannabinus]